MANILVVDDMATILLTERMILASLGHQVRTAMNGEDALKEVGKNPPDLVLCDMLMPGMDGIQFCREMKKSYFTSDIPIVMVTTQSQSAGIEECMNAGCAGHLHKPIGKEQLKNKVNEVLGSRPGGMSTR